MTYGSICSGIEAATAAWRPLGWRPAFFAEIDRFPSAVLAHHYPGVPNLGDFTRIQPGDAGPIDLLVGGTPCQSFSVAGRRLGLDDPRGNLTIEWLRLVRRLLPRWLVWENVPGVLSDNGARTFGTILGELVKLGYRLAWRVLDAQFFGLAQRRKRVFLVGSFGNGPHPGAVLFEPASLSRHPAPSREAGQDVAYTISASASHGSPRGNGYDNLIPATAYAVSARDHKGPNSDVTQCTLITFDETQITSRENRCTPQPGGPSHPLTSHGRPPAIAGTLKSNSGGGGFGSDPSETFIPSGLSAVRRLTPRECERLQGFPDGHTLIPYRGKPAADVPRLKAIGNSMAVPVMRWIGERIAAVEALAAVEAA